MRVAGALSVFVIANEKSERAGALIPVRLHLLPDHLADVIRRAARNPGLENVITDSPHGTYRVDTVQGNTLELFNYDQSLVWYMARK